MVIYTLAIQITISQVTSRKPCENPALAANAVMYLNYCSLNAFSHLYKNMY